MSELSSILKQRRKELGLTLAQIAEAMGVAEATVQRWESGIIKTIRREKIGKLADILSVSPAALIGLEGNYSYVEEKPDEHQLLTGYRSLNREGKEYILQTLDMATRVYIKSDDLPNLEDSLG